MGKKLKETQKSIIKLFHKKYPNSQDRIELAKKYPIQEPIQIIIETTDWSKKKIANKQYQGAASFVISS